jgi:hypothetical protein
MRKEQNTYTSPRTGTEYLIRPKAESRPDYYEMGNPATRYIREYTVYEIVLNGNPVEYAFREEDIPEAVEWFENPPKYDIGSRFD